MMELTLWRILYIDLRNWRRRLGTCHHEPQKRKARPDFKRFDWSVVRTEGCLPLGATPIRMPWRLWVYWKDSAGKIWAIHIDWLWFPPKRNVPT